MAKSPKKVEGRTAKGTFAPGNTGGPGGPRLGAGRKANKAAIIEAIHAIEVDHRGERMPAAEAAFRVIIECMQQPEPNTVRVRAAEIIINRIIGKPVETIDVSGGNNDSLISVIRAASAALNITDAAKRLSAPEPKR